MIGSKRLGNRQSMPATAGIIDMWRVDFGPGVKVIWAEEGGITVGIPGKRGVVPLFSEKREKDVRKKKRR